MMDTDSQIEWATLAFSSRPAHKSSGRRLPSPPPLLIPAHTLLTAAGTRAASSRPGSGEGGASRSDRGGDQRGACGEGCGGGEDCAGAQGGARCFSATATWQQSHQHIHHPLAHPLHVLHRPLHCTRLYHGTGSTSLLSLLLPRGTSCEESPRGSREESPPVIHTHSPSWPGHILIILTYQSRQHGTAGETQIAHGPPLLAGCAVACRRCQSKLCRQSMCLWR